MSGIIDVDLAEVGSSSTTSITVSVTRQCDNEAVIGLVEDDFTILNGSSVEQLPSDTYTDNGDGTYNFDYTSSPLTPGTFTVNLKTAALQTTGGYESSGAVSVVIA